MWLFGFFSKKKDTTRFSSIEAFEKLLYENNLSMGKNRSKLYLMLDFSRNLTTNNILNKNNFKYIDGIRLTFHKHDYKFALQCAIDLIKKGYLVCLQPMITDMYSEKELLELIDSINIIKPHALYIVDSFGVMNELQLKKIYGYYSKHLIPDIKIGAHLHNNKGQALHNAFVLCEESRRDIIIDSTINGMGRGAGNVNTEIIIDYLNNTKEYNYNISDILNLCESPLFQISESNYWGYRTEYLIGALIHCHPNYVSFLCSKNLTVGEVSYLLLGLPKEHLDKFDIIYIKSLYYQYMKEKN